jgi:hypothetical protein
MTGRAVGHQNHANANTVRAQPFAQCLSLPAAGGEPPRGRPQLSMLGVNKDVTTGKVAGNHDRRRQLSVSWLSLDQSWNNDIASEAGERNRPGGPEVPCLTRTHYDKLN